jgi:hypothetical protein
MKSAAILATAAICASATVVPFRLMAQQPVAQAPAARVRKAAVDPAVEQRRITAMGLLTSLADEAKSFKDNKLRARVLAQSADALWDSNNPQAVTLFHKAWQEAEIADKAAAEPISVAANRVQAELGVRMRRSAADVRGEVLRLAAKRDRALGEELLKKLDEARKQELAEGGGAAGSSKTEPWTASVADSKRLGLASQLLQSGEIDRALQFADPALLQVNTQSIFFLSAVREKNANAADERFARLMSVVAQDSATDANTISGLSSYVFTPFLYMTFTKDGGAISAQQRRQFTAPELDPKLRRNFMQLAAQVLLRPLPPPDLDLSTSGRRGKAMVIRRMLPLFESYLPDRFAELNATVAALSTDAPQADKVNEDSNLTRGIGPDDTNKDTSQEMQDRLDRAKDSTERDAIYTNYAVSSARRDYARARELADKIEDSDVRKQVRQYIDLEGINAKLTSEKDAPEAVRIAREGQLDHYQRTWAYTQASRVLAKSDRVRSAELLMDALAEARRIGDGESSDSVEENRARAFVAIASRFVELDKTRAWEMMPDVIKNSNAAPAYTGQDSQIVGSLKTRNSIMMTMNSVEDFDVAGLFRGLADVDLYRAIETAKSLTAESARAAATIAIARSVLDKSGGKRGNG